MLVIVISLRVIVCYEAFIVRVSRDASCRRSLRRLGVTHRGAVTLRNKNADAGRYEKTMKSMDRAKS